MTITPQLALSIYQLAMLIKQDWIDRNPSTNPDGSPITDETVLAGLKVDVERVVGKIDDWNAAHPPVPPAL